jgi:hypothetical protein
MISIRSRGAMTFLALCGLTLSVFPDSATAHPASTRGVQAALTAPAAPAGSTYVSVAPSRVLDTRIGVGAPAAALGSHQSITLHVTGGGVPASATAVALNVTVTQPTAPGWISVGPTPTTTSSNLNFVKGQTVPNFVVSQISGSGTVSLYNGSLGTVQLVADLQGYFSQSGPGSVYVSVAPSRMLDTRIGVGAPAIAVGSHQSITLQIIGGGVPTSATAVALNVTVTLPTAPGWISVGPTPTTTSSNLNFVKGQTIPNFVVSQISDAGTVSLYNGSLGTVQLVADLQGYFSQSGSGSVYVSVAPSRVLDTRIGVGAPAVALGSHQSITLHVVGGSVPASATAVALNVTVTQPTAPGWISVGPAPTTTSSNLNFVRGQTIPNFVASQISGSGTVSLYNGSLGTVQLVADLQGYAIPAPLTLTTTSLHNGVAGLPYTQQLVAMGGSEPYSWTAAGLPAGLSVSADGVLAGTPTGLGTAQATLTVTDSAAGSAAATYGLSVPETLPAACVGQACSQLTPDGQTVQIPATRVGAIFRDTTGTVTQIRLAGAAPTAGQVLVVAATVDAPAGLIVVVQSVIDNGDGTSTIDVSPAGPADAYAEGTVKAVGNATGVTIASGTLPTKKRPMTAAEAAKAAKAAATAKAAGTTGAGQSRGPLGAGTAAGPATRPTAGPASPAPTSMTCDQSVSSELHGLSVSPSLTPTIGALWAHPFFGGGGVYVGPGGLSLFQFDLDGSITVNLGITISGAATCTLTFPSFTATAPAGPLGVVLLQVTPTLTLRVTGKLDLRTSVTFSCGAEYRWDQGQEYRLSYCAHSAQPLQLSADTGIDATATMNLGASLTLDDIIGIDGSISGSVHAGYRPTQHPVAEVDGHVAYDLSACLVCFWNDTPARVTIVSKTVLDKTFLTYDTPPQPPQSTNPVITTAQLPAGVVGQPYLATLTTADNRSGTWSISGGTLPDGLFLSGDTITGKPLTQQTATFQISFTDTAQRTVSATFTITVGPGGGATGAIENLDYCRQNVFAANDDNSVGPVSLPFAVNFSGTTYSSTYVSNNGYIVFDGPRSTYTPFPILDETPTPIIAPFFADVDTRNPGSALVTYGSSPDGKTFCVNWVGVGYFSQHIDKINNFQLLLVDRSDVAAGDFDVIFNYGPMAWETGDASGGTGGIGGYSARAGYSAGTGLPGTSYELPGSGTSGMLLDGEPDQLSGSSFPSDQPLGRYIFPIR